MKFAEDMTFLFLDKMEEPKLKILTELDADASAVEKAIWDKELHKFVKRNGAFKGNLATIQAIVLGQCSKALRDKLRSHNNFKAETKKNNCLLLLLQICSVTLQFDEEDKRFHIHHGCPAEFCGL